MRDGRVRVLPLGGMQEIGKKNCHAILYTKNGVTHVLFLDYGQKLPPFDLNVKPGEILPDEYYPDIRAMLKRDYRVEGVLISHSHRDHAGGLPHLERELTRAYPESGLPTLFASRFGQRVIRNIIYGSKPIEDERKRAERGRKTESIEPGFPMESMRWNEPYRFGPFTVWTFPVIHSTPGSSGFFIEAGGKHILYLGDCKLLGDYHEERRFEETMEWVRQQGVDVLLLDSTNAHEDGRALPERQALNNIAKVMLHRRHSRLAIASFASNVDRQRELIAMARKQGRHVYALGLSMNHYLEADNVGWNEGWRSYRWEQDEAGKKIYPDIPHDAVILMTGIEAEPNSGIFKLLNDVPCWNASIDDVMLSGSTIPHADIIARVESALGLVSKRCKSLYLARNEVILKKEYGNVVWGDYHFSGHGKRDDLEELAVDLVNPRMVIPIHAHRERREEVAGLLAPYPYISVQIAEEGDEINV